MVSAETEDRSYDSLWYTSWWRNNAGEDPIVDRWVSDPNGEDANWHAPSSNMFDSVERSLSG